MRSLWYDIALLPLSQVSSNLHCRLLAGALLVIVSLSCCVLVVIVVGAHGWCWCVLVWSCFAHGGLFACTGKGDVAKLNFTLAALEAEDPFAKKVSLADLVALSHERMCA